MQRFKKQEGNVKNSLAAQRRVSNIHKVLICTIKFVFSSQKDIQYLQTYMKQSPQLRSYCQFDYSKLKNTNQKEYNEENISSNKLKLINVKCQLQDSDNDNRQNKSNNLNDNNWMVSQNSNNNNNNRQNQKNRVIISVQLKLVKQAQLLLSEKEQNDDQQNVGDVISKQITYDGLFNKSIVHFFIMRERNKLLSLNNIILQQSKNNNNDQCQQQTIQKLPLQELSVFDSIRLQSHIVSTDQQNITNYTTNKINLLQQLKAFKHSQLKLQKQNLQLQLKKKQQQQNQIKKLQYQRQLGLKKKQQESIKMLKLLEYQEKKKLQLQRLNKQNNINGNKFYRKCACCHHHHIDQLQNQDNSLQKRDNSNSLSRRKGHQCSERLFDLSVRYKNSRVKQDNSKQLQSFHNNNNSKSKGIKDNQLVINSRLNQINQKQEDVKTVLKKAKIKKDGLLQRLLNHRMSQQSQRPIPSKYYKNKYELLLKNMQNYTNASLNNESKQKCELHHDNKIHAKRCYCCSKLKQGPKEVFKYLKAKKYPKIDPNHSQSVYFSRTVQRTNNSNHNVNKNLNKYQSKQHEYQQQDNSQIPQRQTLSEYDKQQFQHQYQKFTSELKQQQQSNYETSQIIMSNHFNTFGHHNNNINKQRERQRQIQKQFVQGKRNGQQFQQQELDQKVGVRINNSDGQQVRKHQGNQIVQTVDKTQQHIKQQLQIHFVPDTNTKSNPIHKQSQNHPLQSQQQEGIDQNKQQTQTINIKTKQLPHKLQTHKPLISKSKINSIRPNHHILNHNSINQTNNNNSISLSKSTHPQQQSKTKVSKVENNQKQKQKQQKQKQKLQVTQNHPQTKPKVKDTNTYTINKPNLKKQSTHQKNTNGKTQSVNKLNPKTQLSVNKQNTKAQLSVNKQNTKAQLSVNKQNIKAQLSVNKLNPKQSQQSSISRLNNKRQNPKIITLKKLAQNKQKLNKIKNKHNQLLSPKVQVQSKDQQANQQQEEQVQKCQQGMKLDERLIKSQQKKQMGGNKNHLESQQQDQSELIEKDRKQEQNDSIETNIKINKVNEQTTNINNPINNTNTNTKYTNINNPINNQQQITQLNNNSTTNLNEKNDKKSQNNIKQLKIDNQNNNNYTQQLKNQKQSLMKQNDIHDNGEQQVQILSQQQQQNSPPKDKEQLESQQKYEENKLSNNVNENLPITNLKNTKQQQSPKNQNIQYMNQQKKSTQKQNTFNIINQNQPQTQQHNQLIINGEKNHNSQNNSNSKYDSKQQFKSRQQLQIAQQQIVKSNRQQSKTQVQQTNPTQNNQQDINIKPVDDSNTSNNKELKNQHMITKKTDQLQTVKSLNIKNILQLQQQKQQTLEQTSIDRRLYSQDNQPRLQHIKQTPLKLTTNKQQCHQLQVQQIQNIQYKKQNGTIHEVESRRFNHQQQQSIMNQKTKSVSIRQIQKLNSDLCHPIKQSHQQQLEKYSNQNVKEQSHQLNQTKIKLQQKYQKQKTEQLLNDENKVSSKSQRQHQILVQNQKDLTQPLINQNTKDHMTDNNNIHNSELVNNNEQKQNENSKTVTNLQQKDEKQIDVQSIQQKQYNSTNKKGNRTNDNNYLINVNSQQKINIKQFTKKDILNEVKQILQQNVSKQQQGLTAPKDINIKQITKNNQVQYNKRQIQHNIGQRPLSKIDVIDIKQIQPNQIQVKTPEQKDTFDEKKDTFDEKKDTFDEKKETFDEKKDTFDEKKDTFDEKKDTFDEKKDTFDEKKDTFDEKKDFINKVDLKQQESNNIKDFIKKQNLENVKKQYSVNSQNEKQKSQVKAEVNNIINKSQLKDLQENNQLILTEDIVDNNKPHFGDDQKLLANEQIVQLEVEKGQQQTIKVSGKNDDGGNIVSQMRGKQHIRQRVNQVKEKDNIKIEGEEDNLNRDSEQNEIMKGDNQSQTVKSNQELTGRQQFMAAINENTSQKVDDCNKTQKQLDSNNKKNNQHQNTLSQKHLMEKINYSSQYQNKSQMKVIGSQTQNKSHQILENEDKFNLQNQQDQHKQEPKLKQNIIKPTIQNLPENYHRHHNQLRNTQSKEQLIVLEYKPVDEQKQQNLFDQQTIRNIHNQQLTIQQYQKYQKYQKGSKQQQPLNQKCILAHQIQQTNQINQPNDISQLNTPIQSIISEQSQPLLIGNKQIQLNQQSQQLAGQTVKVSQQSINQNQLVNSVDDNSQNEQNIRQTNNIISQSKQQINKNTISQVQQNDYKKGINKDENDMPQLQKSKIQTITNDLTKQIKIDDYHNKQKQSSSQKNKNNKDNHNDNHNDNNNDIDNDNNLQYSESSSQQEESKLQPNIQLNDKQKSNNKVDNNNNNSQSEQHQPLQQEQLSPSVQQQQQIQVIDQQKEVNQYRQGDNNNNNQDEQQLRQNNDKQQQSLNTNKSINNPSTSNQQQRIKPSTTTTINNSTNFNNKNDNNPSSIANHNHNIQTGVDIQVQTQQIVLQSMNSITSFKILNNYTKTTKLSSHYQQTQQYPNTQKNNSNKLLQNGLLYLRKSNHLNKSSQFQQYQNDNDYQNIVSLTNDEVKNEQVKKIKLVFKQPLSVDIRTIDQQSLSSQHNDTHRSISYNNNNNYKNNYNNSQQTDNQKLLLQRTHLSQQQTGNKAVQQRTHLSQQQTVNKAVQQRTHLSQQQTVNKAVQQRTHLSQQQTVNKAVQQRTHLSQQQTGNKAVHQSRIESKSIHNPKYQQQQKAVQPIKKQLVSSADQANQKQLTSSNPRSKLIQTKQSLTNIPQTKLSSQNLNRQVKQSNSQSIKTATNQSKQPFFYLQNELNKNQPIKNQALIKPNQISQSNQIPQTNQIPQNNESNQIKQQLSNNTQSPIQKQNTQQQKQNPLMKLQTLFLKNNPLTQKQQLIPESIPNSIMEKLAPVLQSNPNNNQSNQSTSNNNKVSLQYLFANLNNMGKITNHPVILNQVIKSSQTHFQQDIIYLKQSSSFQSQSKVDISPLKYAIRFVNKHFGENFILQKLLSIESKQICLFVDNQWKIFSYKDVSQFSHNIKLNSLIMTNQAKQINNPKLIKQLQNLISFIIQNQFLVKKLDIIKAIQILTGINFKKIKSKQHYLSLQDENKLAKKIKSFFSPKMKQTEIQNYTQDKLVLKLDDTHLGVISGLQVYKAASKSVYSQNSQRDKQLLSVKSQSQKKQYILSYMLSSNDVIHHTQLSSSSIYLTHLNPNIKYQTLSASINNVNTFQLYLGNCMLVAADNDFRFILYKQTAKDKYEIVKDGKGFLKYSAPQQKNVYLLIVQPLLKNRKTSSNINQTQINQKGEKTLNKNICIRYYFKKLMEQGFLDRLIQCLYSGKGKNHNGGYQNDKNLYLPVERIQAKKQKSYQKSQKNQSIL